MGKTKTIKFNISGIEKIPNNKPIIYKILTENNKVNYTGIAKRGRGQKRILEHIGEIPGAKVKIEQMNSIEEARKKESNIITRTEPKYNKKGC